MAGKFRAQFQDISAAADFLGNGAIEVNRYESEIVDLVRRHSIFLQRVDRKPATGHPHRYFEHLAIASAAFTDPRNINPTPTGPNRVERAAFINMTTETEQAEAALRMSLALPAVAELIAKDARENLGDLDVVSVGSVYAREIQGVTCYLVVAIVPDRDGKDFVPSQVILDTTQNYMVAAVNRMTLISCLEELFVRVQVFGTELALARYCQKEWPSEEMDQAVAEMKRGLN